MDYTDKDFTWKHFFECLEYKFSNIFVESFEDEYGRMNSFIQEKGFRNVIDALLDKEGYPAKEYNDKYETVVYWSLKE